MQDTLSNRQHLVDVMPNKTAAPSNESVRAESARLRVEFLEIELDLTETMLQRTLSAYGDHSQTKHHIRQALDTIRKFLAEVTSPKDHARIAERLMRLEREFPANSSEYIL